MKNIVVWIGATAAVAAFSIFFISCQQAKDATLVSPAGIDQGSFTVRQPALASTEAGSMNGIAGSMPAYYDDVLFTINFMELPPTGEKATLANNQSINVIYMSDNGLPGNAPFISVLDAIQGDGFNPLWLEVQITFNAGFTPRQLTSDTDIEAAASSSPPEITLTPTDEVYRCSVIGKR